MSAGEVALMRARAAIGARFRLHGRDPASGLDCVGLAGHALGQSDLPSGYALRARDRVRVEAAVARLGLKAGAIGEGDLLLLDGGQGQVHLAIANGGGADCGAVHADIALRRIVERPGPLPWPIVARWHVPERMED